MKIFLNKVQSETLSRYKHGTSLFVRFIFIFLNPLVFLLEKSRKLQRLPLSATLFLVILPMVFLSVFLCVREFTIQTKAAFERRESLATLEASFVREKLDGLVDIGTSLATRPMIYKNIEAGNWGESVKNMEVVLQALPDINSVAILDKEGVLKAVTPPMSEVMGKSFAHRDYYQGVAKEWKPYVSEVFMRSIEPKYSVISVAIPVRSFDQKVTGIFLLTIKSDTIIRWIKEINTGFGGLTYLVDKNGKLIAHPSLKSGDEIVDYSMFSVVQKLIRGERGSEMFFDPDEKEYQVVAYSPVKKYEVGVVVAQSAGVAFAERSNKVAEYIIFWVLIAFIFSFSSYRILKDRIAIIDQRDRERTLLESMGDGVVAIDRDWHITLWNKAASTITGWNKDEVLGKPFRTIIRFIRERDRKEDIAFIEDAIVMRKTSFMEAGTLLIKKDGSEVATGDSVAPLIDQNGNTEGAIVVFRDASKERESAHLRSDLAYATHQFRTPVTEALWNLEIGMSEQDADKRKEDLRIAYQALLSIKKLSEHLVAVSEIDKGDIVVNLSKVRLIDVLIETQNKVALEAKKYGVEIFISPISPLVAVSTDPKFLKRIFFEIIENAVVYSRHGAEVIVAATFHKKELLIEVVDTGMGIMDEQQPLIFTKFFRGTNSAKKCAGSGLGLYLAKAYVMLLGGKIWFKSEEGKGTTFYVSLPIE